MCPKKENTSRVLITSNGGWQTVQNGASVIDASSSTQE